MIGNLLSVPEWCKEGNFYKNFTETIPNPLDNYKEYLSDMTENLGIPLEYYQKRDIKCEFIFFTQELVTDKTNRSISKIHDLNNVKGFLLKTLNYWVGDDEDILWAKNDDDLLSILLKDI